MFCWHFHFFMYFLFLFEPLFWHLQSISGCIPYFAPLGVAKKSFAPSPLHLVQASSQTLEVTPCHQAPRANEAPPGVSFQQLQKLTFLVIFVGEFLSNSFLSVQSSVTSILPFSTVSPAQVNPPRTRVSGMMLKCLYLAWLAPVFGEESCMIQVQNMEKVESKSPVEYTATWSSATRALVYEHYAGPKGGSPCGPPIKDQKMYFAGPGRCSIASANMVYLAHDGTIKHARKGEIIEMNCDDVYCPIPVIADCYMSPDICSKNEWCWVRQHEKWGAWAMGPLPNGTFGHTPAMEYCKEFIPAYEEALKIAQQENDLPKIIQLNRSLEILCPSSSQTFSNAWRPIRGQCVPFRQEQQSCFQQQDLSPAFTGSLAPRYMLDNKGAPMERPLACAPDLTCTAPNFNVLPSTCVQKRPRDICYYGPWWDSSDCPRQKMMMRPGLNYNLTVDAMISAAMLYPGEIASMGSCTYWDRTTTLGKSVLRVREQVYKIAVDLWPYQLLKPPPSLEELSEMLPDPFWYLVHVKNMSPEEASRRCPIYADDKKSKVSQLLAEASILSAQPNKVWSLVHFFTFNLIDLQITQEKGLASQALATLLAQNFWCNDCRSFFEVGVIEQFGLPPLGTGMDIAKWWHHAHNTASEHVATTRAGHPWIHQLDALPSYQNPFYMTWEDAYHMWHVKI